MLKKGLLKVVLGCQSNNKKSILTTIPVVKNFEDSLVAMASCRATTRGIAVALTPDSRDDPRNLRREPSSHRAIDPFVRRLGFGRYQVRSSRQYCRKECQPDSRVSSLYDSAQSHEQMRRGGTGLGNDILPTRQKGRLGLGCKLRVASCELRLTVTVTSSPSSSLSG